jgi:hypothetical protein
MRVGGEADRFAGGTGRLEEAHFVDRFHRVG